MMLASDDWTLGVETNIVAKSGYRAKPISNVSFLALLQESSALNLSMTSAFTTISQEDGV